MRACRLIIRRQASGVMPPNGALPRVNSVARTNLGLPDCERVKLVCLSSASVALAPDEQTAQPRVRCASQNSVQDSLAAWPAARATPADPATASFLGGRESRA